MGNFIKLCLFFACISLVTCHRRRSNCREKSITTATGTGCSTTYCPEELIFEDNFDKLDLSIWERDNTLAGGGNWEFQWYTNDNANSYVEEGVLIIRPTLLSNEYGESFLTSGLLKLENCTFSEFYGCERRGTFTHVLNPIMSARLGTKNSFAFKYGRVEIKAKLPAGDWLWPTFLFLPKENKYGAWPRSGAMDLVSSRGNQNLTEHGINIGTEQISSTLYFGPSNSENGWQNAHLEKNSEPGNGWNKEFHRYGMEWTPEYIIFTVDDIELGKLDTGSGFWARGSFGDSAHENLWSSGGKNAPFDEEFYINMALAVGGVSNYFSDTAENPGGKPWKNNSPAAATDFWNGRKEWLPTWNLDKRNYRDSCLQIDYIKVWAL